MMHIASMLVRHSYWAESRSRLEHLLSTNTIIVLNSYFNLTNKSNFMDRLYYDLIRFFDNMIVVCFFGHPVNRSAVDLDNLLLCRAKCRKTHTNARMHIRHRLLPCAFCTNTVLVWRQSIFSCSFFSENSLYDHFSMKHRGSFPPRGWTTWQIQRTKKRLCPSYGEKDEPRCFIER